jgi:hypothetical protein
LDIISKVDANAQGGISTFTRFFRRFTQKRNTAVFPALFGWFFTQIKLRRYTIDLDSSVLTRYGEQQGAEVGYNPTKPGRASHHPLIAFVSEVRMVANAWLRSGDSATTNNVFGFLRETIDRVLPEKEIGLLRADSGFFGGKLFEFLEERKINYIIACRMYPPLKRRIRALKDWVVVDRGIEIAEFDYETSRWFGASRRMVVVRQSVAARPTAGGKTLFDDDQALADYRYQCYVTNLDLPVVSVWQLYRGRSDAENRIKELKYDFGMKGFSLNDFWATEAAFRMVCFSYNLMALFRQVILKADSVPMLSTLRLKCFAIGSYLRTKGREKILMLSVKMERRAWMDGLFSELATFTQPFPLRI